jgi:hypothetical protein
MRGTNVSDYDYVVKSLALAVFLALFSSWLLAPLMIPRGYFWGLSCEETEMVNCGYFPGDCCPHCHDWDSGRRLVDVALHPRVGTGEDVARGEIFASVCCKKVALVCEYIDSGVVGEGVTNEPKRHV